MFHVALTALHDRTTDTCFPGLAIVGEVGFGEMQVGVRHHEVFSDAIEAKLAICFFERERMRGWGFFSVQEPFVHTPEMTGPDIEVEIIDEPGDQG